MNPIKALMGGRQFLMAAGVASTMALSCKKLAGFLKTEEAMAADKAESAGINEKVNRCPHLLSPLKIGNRVLKNRIMHTISPVYTLQGPENYPTAAWRNHYSNIAKNAAIVTIETCFGKYPKKYHTKEENPAYWSWEHISNNKWEDIPPVYNYLERVLEDVHCEGSLVLFGSNTGDVGDAIVAGDSSGQKGTANLAWPGGPDGPPPGRTPGGPKPMAMGPKSVDEIAKEALEYEETGYDIYEMNMPTLEAVEAVRSATNLIIMASLRIGGMGWGPNIPGIVNMNKPTASQLEKAVETVRKLEGLVDFVRIRGGIYGNWVQEKDELLAPYYYAEAIKKAGLKILTCIGSGFYDPIKNDKFIKSGITDMISMTRPLFADGELVRKVAAGRVDDVIPCIQCQNCHAVSMAKGPHYAQCTVNPKWSTPTYKLSSIKEPLRKKKVAVIGGGPAGMKAAITASDRGHAVTLYEKDAALGGLQKYTDYTKWNWTYKVFKDWLIQQVKKKGIEVKLNTAATFSMIKSAGYDTVLVATGAELVKSGIKDVDTGKVFDILSCYRNKKALGKKVVMISAGKFGTEAAISMVKDGHKVTVLAPGEEMIDPGDIGSHSVTHQENIYKNHPDFKYFMKTVVRSIEGGKVTYRDEKGSEKSIKADSIVIWSGLRPRTEDAETFTGSADEVLMVGDCKGDTNRLIKTMRQAFFIASQV